MGIEAGADSAPVRHRAHLRVGPEVVPGKSSAAGANLLDNWPILLQKSVETVSEP
jgi:hypothetical protein